MKAIEMVQKEVLNEYERAKKKFHAINSGPHEGYAVILEEYEEAKNELEKTKEYLDEFWFKVKGNCTAGQYINLKFMKEHAEKAAAECIQVAAMCHKAILTQDAKFSDNGEGATK